jgi:hypothetical protein
MSIATERSDTDSIERTEVAPQFPLHHACHAQLCNLHTRSCDAKKRENCELLHCPRLLEERRSSRRCPPNVEIRKANLLVDCSERILLERVWGAGLLGLCCSQSRSRESQVPFDHAHIKTNLGQVIGRCASRVVRSEA